LTAERRFQTKSIVEAARIEPRSGRPRLRGLRALSGDQGLRETRAFPTREMRPLRFARAGSRASTSFLQPEYPGRGATEDPVQLIL
jgi:hypothetical protein